MCDECHQRPHATMCPNGTPMVDVIYAECVLCGAEEDETEIYYGICEKCWKDHHNFDNAMAYGATVQAKDDVTINGFYAYILTPEQIEVALRQVVMDMKKYYYDFAIKTADEFLRDDDGDFADWLKEQKNID